MITRLDNPLGIKYLVNRAFLRCALAVHAQGFSSVCSSELLPSIVGLGIHCKHSNPAMDPIKETVY